VSVGKQVARKVAPGDAAKSLTNEPSNGITLHHFICLSTDIKPLLIVFRYRRMRQLY
jgi:hypothetical protein